MAMTEPTLEALAACPLCGGGAFAERLSGPDYFMKLPGTFRLVECRDCGLLFQNPRPPLSEIERYYPNSYGSYDRARSGIKAQRGLMRRVIERGQGSRCRLIDRMVPGGPRRLLDVGCASGLFLETMQGYSRWQVEGVELNRAAAEATAERLGIPVFAGPLEAAEYPAATFDAITLWDVLEHLHDPLASLRELRRILKPGGLVMLRVPNADSYVATLCRRYWSGYDLPRHMTLFNAATLEAMLTRAGFGPPQVQYTSGSYLAALHSLRWALDDGRLPPERAARIHRSLLHPLVRLAVRAPFLAADRFVGGSNLEVVVTAL